MFHKLILLVLASLVFPAMAASPQLWSWFVQGPWVVSVESQKRDRVLVIPEPKVTPTGTLTANEGVYGWIDGKLGPTQAIDIRLDEENAFLTFTTPADSKISVALRIDEVSALGTFSPKTGSVLQVRLTKVSRSEWDVLRQSAQLVKKLDHVAINPSSQISMLYVGAGDCPSCRGYEIEYFGRKDLIHVSIPGFDSIRYFKAHLGSYKGCAGLASTLPAELAPLAQGDKPELSCYGTPYFAVLLDGKVIAKGFGMTTLENLIIPMTNGLIEKKRRL